jgi:cobalt-precorrin 5A hydrolase
MIVAGFGFRGAAQLPSLRAALAMAQFGQPPVEALATAADKAPALAALAKALALPLIAVAPDAICRIATPTNSPASMAARGTGSMAEAAALAAAGGGARLLSTRHISPDRMASCAIAEGVSP